MIDLTPLAQFMREFGFPITALGLVIYASARGLVVWKPSHDAVVKALSDQVMSTARERDRLFQVVVPAVRAVEQGAEALKVSREGS